MKTEAILLDYEAKKSTKDASKVNYFVTLVTGDNILLNLFADESQFIEIQKIKKRSDVIVDLRAYECARDNFGNPMYKFSLNTLERKV